MTKNQTTVKAYTATKLASLIEQTGLKKQTIAEKLDISPAHLSKILSKKVNISKKINEKIKNNLLIYKELKEKGKK